MSETDLDSQEPATERVRVRVREKRKRKRPVRTAARISFTVLFILFLLLAADGVFAASKLFGSLPDIEDSLTEAEEAIRDSRFDAARTSLEEALKEAETAESASRRPSVTLASILPWVGDEADALRALTSAARISSEAGVEFLDGIKAVDPDAQELMSSIYVDGQVQFASIEEIKPYVDRAGELLDEANELLRRSPDASIEPLQDALVTAREDIGTADQATEKARALLEGLPGLLGDGGQKRYLLAFQTPSEARGSGGLIGLYGILQAENGRISLPKVRPIADFFEPFAPVDAPPWFRDRYASLAGLREVQQTNFSPHFPVVSDVVLQMYERISGERLDGVFAMDPIALQELTRATGPITVDGFEQTVGPDNAADVLLYDSYADFTTDEQNVFLGRVISRLWERLGSGAVDAPVLAEALADSVRSQHLKLYSTDELEQKRITAMGADGTFVSRGPDVQMVFHSNYAANKVDYFLDREQKTLVELDSQGTALVTTTVSLHNRAPKDGPSLVVSGGSRPGQNVKGYPPGFNGMFLNFLLPERADVQNMTIDGEPAAYLLDNEAGFPVAWDLVELKSGEKATAKVVYLLPDAANLDEGDGWDLTLFPQAVVRPDRFTFTLEPPPGYEAEFVGSIDDELPGVGVTVSGTLDEVLTLDTKVEKF